MSFLHKNLREWVMSKLMSVSVSHEPKRDPDFVEKEVVEKSLIKSPEDELSATSFQESSSLEKPSTAVVTQKKDLIIEYLQGDQLTREFGFDRDLSKTHTLHLCIYKINNVLSSPFLEFYLEKTTTEYEFPQKELPPELFKDFVQDDTISVVTNESTRIEPMDQDESKILVGGQGSKILTTNSEGHRPEEFGQGEPDIEDVFLEQIKAFYKEKTGSLLSDEKYRGFLEIDHHIFAIIECGGEPIFQNESKWAIIDEIVRKKAVLNIAISPLVIDLFDKNRVLGKIGQESPQVLYLCKSEDGSYKNVYYDEGAGSHNTVTIINERIQHPTLKQIYLFSETPFPNDLPIAQIKRFALFTDPANKIQGEMESASIPQGPVIGFRENDVDFWCTKSPKYFAEL